MMNIMNYITNLLMQKDQEFHLHTHVLYFSIDNAHPKLFRHSFWCRDNAHDAN